MCEVERQLIKLYQSKGHKGLLPGRTGILQHEQ